MTRANVPEPTRAEAFRAGVLALRPQPSPGDLVLLDEACRLIDRSDRFDAVICGDMNAWVQIEWPFEDQPARLVISSVVSEARSTVTELRQVVKALDLPVSAAAGAGAEPTPLELLLGGQSG